MKRGDRVEGWTGRARTGVLGTVTKVIKKGRRTLTRIRWDNGVETTGDPKRAVVVEGGAS